MPCLSQAIVAVNGGVIINNGSVVDGYNSSLGIYGPGNEGLSANVQASGSITNYGQVTGSLIPNTTCTTTPIPSPVVTPLGVVLVNSNQTLELAAGNYSASSFTVNGTFHADGPVRIWVSGAATIGGTCIPTSGHPGDLWIILGGTGQFQLNAGAVAEAVVDAPLASAIISSSLQGGLVAANVTLNSGGGVHLDSQVACNGSGGTVLAAISHSSTTSKFIRGVKLDRPVIVAPNPCRGQAIVWYNLSQEATVQVVIYDIAGEQVYRRWIGQQQAGTWQQSLNLNGMANGVYVLRVLLDGQRCGSCDFKLAIIR